MQDCAAGKMAAEPDDSYTGHDRDGLALEQVDGRIRPHDPASIVGVEVNRGSEGASPVLHPGVVVRVRDHDSREATERVYDLFRGLIEQGQAVPEHVA